MPSTEWRRCGRYGRYIMLMGYGWKAWLSPGGQVTSPAVWWRLRCGRGEQTWWEPPWGRWPCLGVTLSAWRKIWSRAHPLPTESNPGEGWWSTSGFTSPQLSTLLSHSVSAQMKSGDRGIRWSLSKSFKIPFCFTVTDNWALERPCGRPGCRSSWCSCRAYLIHPRKKVNGWFVKNYSKKLSSQYLHWLYASILWGASLLLCQRSGQKIKHTNPSLYYDLVDCAIFGGGSTQFRNRLWSTKSRNGIFQNMFTWQQYSTTGQRYCLGHFPAPVPERKLVGCYGRASSHSSHPCFGGNGRKVFAMFLLHQISTN